MTGGSETDDAEESEEAKKKVSRPSSSSSSCDLPLCYDMSDETNMSQANPYVLEGYRDFTNFKICRIKLTQIVTSFLTMVRSSLTSPSLGL